ncbi:hypothetical protein CHBNIII6_02660 [Haemophilus influenzae]|nr:hypothetical protein CHBNIII6_02660 [Haemophilus influenzae]
MAIFEPKQLFFPVRKQISYFRITELGTIILPILLILPSQRPIEDKTRATTELLNSADLFAVWHYFELKGFA